MPYVPYSQTPMLIQAANPMGSSLTSTGMWDRFFAGYFSNCAMQADSTTTGSLWCWGSNVSGQLGDKTQTNRTQPVPVRNITNGVDSWWLGVVNNAPVPSVALGESHTCGIRSDQTIACWGNNTSNQLGIGGSIPATQLYPVPITLPMSASSSMHFIRISARKSITCAISEDQPGQTPPSDYDKRLWCWGGTSSTTTPTSFGYGATPTLITK
jgi:alpha-tubulin suppressor-like RCC1 family protein